MVRGPDARRLPLGACCLLSLILWVDDDGASRPAARALPLCLEKILLNRWNGSKEFQGDPTEHVSLSNVLGPNPWNVGAVSEPTRSKSPVPSGAHMCTLHLQCSCGLQQSVHVSSGLCFSGFILNGRLPEQVIQLLKAFLRSVAMRFPKSYSLEEAEESQRKSSSRAELSAGSGASLPKMIPKRLPFTPP